MESDTNMPLAIRRAENHELEAVHGLIVELAAYERAEDQVFLTLAQFAKDAAEGHFEVTVAATHGGDIVGMALHHPRYSTWEGRTWYLEDLVVTESWRGRGVGKALFDAVVACANEQQAKRLEWQVLEWNAPAIGFYEKLGARVSADWLNGRLTREQLTSWTQIPTQ
ncbi:MAG: GNAT family N-acetyltransferase [Bacteroidota bacterium]|nr:GNAT family N-acetyltransferase [Bacteroidota bacterium]